MEYYDIISLFFMGISILSICTILTIKLYNFVYKVGYSHGFHSGVSHGMFKAHIRMNRKQV